MPQLTSRPGSSQMRFDLEKTLSLSRIVSLLPDAEPDSSQIVKAMPVEPLSFYPQIYHS